MVENGSHGYYTAHVAKEVIEEHFKVTKNIEEDRIALPYTEQVN